MEQEVLSLFKNHHQGKKKLLTVALKCFQGYLKHTLSNSLSSKIDVVTKFEHLNLYVQEDVGVCKAVSEHSS